MLLNLPLVGTIGNVQIELKEKPEAEPDWIIDNPPKNPKFQFDYNKGLFWQVWTADWTWEEYVEYINTPKHFIKMPKEYKFCDNPILNYFFKGQLWHIMITYIPYCIWCYVEYRDMYYY